MSSLIGGDIPEQEQARSKLSLNQLPGNRPSSAERDISQLSNCSNGATVSKIVPGENEDVKFERYRLGLFLFTPGSLFLF